MLIKYKPFIRYIWRYYSSVMAAVSKSDYEKVVSTLNGLQTNAQVLAEIRKQSKNLSEVRFASVGVHLNRIGIDVDDLDDLNIIHVAGTKGKGSVCAMCESILRLHGLKTGFFSSPHLVEVRERIRINGVPLDKDSFVTYFWKCYDSLMKDKDNDSMPGFFAFLTLMAYQVFLSEKVDVAIIEVGIGGTYDSTNIIRRPKVCGITSLGYDHMDVLGQSLEEITWHKAGIIKEGSPVFTSLQPPEALRVITSRSVELKASCIYVAPPSQSYNGTINDIGIAGNHQFENASLAVQLCRQWMTEMRKWPGKTITGCQDTNGIPIADTFDLPATFIKGLHECYWPGRCELIKQKGVSYYVDGAHTFKSLLECSKWFKQAASDEALQVQGPVSRILIFNFSGRRDADRLMSNLLDLGFDHALFCPNITTLDDISTDQTNYNASTSEVVRRCYNNELIWQRAMNVDKCETKVFMSISETIEHVGILREEKYGTYLQVLVCGSLHLVGGVMKVLDYSVSTC